MKKNKIISRPADSLPREHCCSRMDYVVQDIRIPLKYYPAYRRYALPFIKNNVIIHPIDYCPWCGTKLPKNLQQERLEILEREYGLDASFGSEDEQKIPEEFKTDEWWKKRSL